MQWGALKTAVTSWVARGDVASMLDTFVVLAEQRIYSGTADIQPLRLQSMLATLSPFTPGALPAGFLAAERVTALVGGRKVPLEYRSPDQLSTSEGNAGSPQCYTVRGTELVVGPTFTQQVEMLYYARPATPSADGDENVVMRDFPSLYLHGMLMEAATWVRDDGMLARHASLFSGAMKSAQRRSDDSRAGAAPLRITNTLGVRV